eukprot:Hpha_TRINITY_DN35233_c0_g1::TRINITY_DN35233_c0_g1_i1::g.145100::m.145100/K01565/SGSH; N-sulfoglucosamine sulfohydrolase
MRRGLLLALILFCGGVSARNKNILLMVADDGGFEFPMWGNNVTGAVHLAKLADRGTTFDRAFTAVSSCSPSRSALLTGLPTHQNGMYGLHQFPGNFQSNKDVTSMPNLLTAAGYKTGILGKYHVGPIPNYQFTYGLTPEHCWAGAVGDPLVTQVPSEYCKANYNDVSRNITAMKLRARQFLTEIEPEKPWLLYVGFGDCHRCGFESSIGSFCENYGDPSKNGGFIPDWKPVHFSTNDVIVPSFLPDTQAVRQDIAGQYTAVNRMDTGIGLLVAEVDRAGATQDTLVVYFSDNGIPFPSGKTNINTNQGHGEPLVIVNPDSSLSAQRSSHTVGSLDILPTVLDWAGVKYPQSAKAGNKKAELTGTSLLPLTTGASSSDGGVAFASHNYHSLYCYYPARAVVSGGYRLTHNIAHSLSYGILEDVYVTTTWKQIANGTITSEWVYNYTSYKHRPEFELYDINADPMGLHNLAEDAAHAETFAELHVKLMGWRNITHDPWLPCDTSGADGICSL